MPQKGPATVKHRLSRIEGQIRGLERLLEGEENEQKFMIQLQAVISALESLKLEMIKKRLREEIKESMLKAINQIG